MHKIKPRHVFFACGLFACLPVALGDTTTIVAPGLEVTGNREPLPIDTSPIIMTGNRAPLPIRTQEIEMAGNRAPQTINTQAITMTGNRGLQEP